MPSIVPTGGILGADVLGLDLAQPLADADFALLLRALGQHGVLRIPGQRIGARALRDFSLRFGPIQTGVADRFRDPEVPEVGILSNIRRDGAPIGLADAGQDWHTDMTYTATARLRERALRRRGADAGRPAAGRYALRQHARRLRRPAGRGAAAAGRHDRDA